MGPARVGPAVDRRGRRRAFAGTAVDVGNPHLACVTDVALDALDLTASPATTAPVPARGERRVRVAGARRAGGDAGARARGGGDPLVRDRHGRRRRRRAARRGRDDRRRRGATPGGRLRVTVADGTTVLHGPAVLVASGELDADWWAGL
jgi:diaminopimelate epimerase